VDSPWQTPVRITALNTTGDDVFPVISANGLAIYFCDYFSRPSVRPGNRGVGDIWVSRRASASTSWQAAVNLGAVVNSSALEYGPAISADELELFFTSDRAGGSGQADLWVSRRTDAAISTGWISAQNLGAAINSPNVDCCPWLSRDGLTLYFSSNRPHPGLPAGINRIWVTRRASRTSPFGTPVSLGESFPDFSNMVDPCFSPDGSTFIFTTLGRLANPDTTGNIWQAPMITPPLSISLLPAPEQPK
jgi:hypothetical protein